MQQNNVIDRIEFVLNEDKNTNQKFELSQFDYNFSSGYSSNDSSDRQIEVYISGSINATITELFLKWISNQPGDWSGSIKLFFKNNDTPQLTLTFGSSSVSNFSQSFIENNTYAHDAYFTEGLQHVFLNNLKMS